jgi:16S rRNA (cytosine967-C5)-methyltransferase
VRTPTLKTDSLAYALHGAAQAAASVQGGTALPQALTRIAGRNEAAAQARGAVQDIAYRSMRQWGRANVLLDRLVAKPPPAPLRALLACALALLCEDDQPYPAFTVVDQAVTAASADPKTTHAKGLVNAVLRRFLREREELMAAVLRHDEARWNYPVWWIAGVRNAYPSSWEDILEIGNTPPPLTLRVNQRKTSVEKYLSLLTEHDIAAKQIGPQAIRLNKPVPVQHIPGFGDGMASVQDAAAQLAPSLLDVQDGMRVLDACAAPGGKTGHLLESANLDLLALDADGERLQRVTQNLERLQLSASLQVGDAAGRAWWDGRPFDRILADVPCTASGIVRRHPDIRWLRRPDDADRLATLSAQILDNLWQMLKPDGKLLLVTCSLWPQESEAQAASFAERHHALRLPAPGQLLPTADETHDHDGLFYALFQKRVA